MNVFFLSDNRNRRNWGCRSTSKALKDLVAEKNEIIYTVYGNNTISYQPFALRDKIYSFKDRVRMALCRRNILRDYLLRTDPYNIIKSSVEESYRMYKRMLLNNPLSYYKEIDDNLRVCDALVCNGEGTLIFTNPPRYDTIFYALIFKLAQEYGKKTYMLNAMFSDFPGKGRNEVVLNECKEIFYNCTLITARDPLSYEYYKKNIGDNVVYVPDALFSWTKYGDYLPLAKRNPKAFISFPEYDDKIEDFDFSKPYICLSGSSLVAWNQEKAREAYTELAKTLKKNFRVIVVPTCDGDRFLRKVAKEADCPLVPVETNIFMGMSILANADVFVSGRWHPSILASLGGTPCVFMGSNSHKTLALQYMLEYPEKKEYSAIPMKDEINNIVEDCKRLISQGQIERNRILSIVNNLSNDALGNMIS